MISPLSVRYSSEPILLRVYANGEGEGGDEGESGDEGEQGDEEGGGHGRRGGDEDNQGGDRDDDGDDEGEHHFRKFFNFKQLERDDEHKKESKKESAEPKPKTYDGYNFVKDGDKKRKEFNFAAAGDFGCSKNTKKTINNIEDKKPELVLPLGDLSYQSTADCWFHAMSPLKGKIMITLGFHEVNDGKSKMNQYINSFDLDKHYNSFDYRHVHFVTMASESKFEEGSAQYKFINEDLKKASENKDIDWIVVTTYGPFYTSPSTHKAEKVLRDIYHPIFEKYNVDLVLQAHNHNYQRTYPISYNSAGDSSEPIVTKQNTTGYNNSTDGTVFALVGTGGESFYPLDGQAPYVASQFDKFGFLDIDISNGNPHTTLTGTFYDNKGDEVLDQFTIEKEIKNTDVDIQPEPLSASHASQNLNPNHDYLPSCNYCDK
jgi:Calcineurin-like phosphoesterase